MIRPKGNGKKVKQTGFSNTASGKLNAKSITGCQKPLHIPETGLQVEDVKTLKKPIPKMEFKEFDQTVYFPEQNQDRIAISLDKFAKDPQNKVLSCLYGLASQKSKTKHINLQSNDYYPSAATTKLLVDTDNADILLQLDRTIKRPVSLGHQDTRPAPVKLNNFMRTLQNDNTVISAYIKNNFMDLPKIDRIDVLDENVSQNAHIAEDKLRKMFNKTAIKRAAPQQPQISIQPITSKSRLSDSSLKGSKSQIEEVLEEEYLNNQFEEESQIKESIIKESMARDSMIKESIIKQSIPHIRESKESGIRQSIRESIRSSGRDSRSSIKEDIPAESMSKSRNSIRESIHQATERPPAKKPQKHDDDIEESIEEIYEEDFDEASASVSMAKNVLTPHKHGQLHVSEESMSKSFRKKKSVHTPHIGSIKLAEEINMKQSKQQFEEFVKTKESAFAKHGLKQEFSHLKEIVNEQEQVEKIQQQVKQTLGRTKNLHDQWKYQEHIQRQKYSKERVNNLYYRFQSQLTKLITSQDLSSKLSRLTSFLPSSLPSPSVPSAQTQLTNTVLSKILDAITNLRQTALDYNALRQMQQEYDKKMDNLLKNQERLLRMQMEKKLDERDEQIRKLIEGMGKGAANTGRDRIMDVLKKNRSVSWKEQKVKTEEEIAQYEEDKFEEMSASKKDIPSFGGQSAEKDYSMEFEAVSWDNSINLWENLSATDKAKLYEKQAGQVTDFLAGIMMKELKSQALKRSLDVSFEFPEEVETEKSQPSLIPLGKKKVVEQPPVEMFKPAFDRQSLQKQLSESGSSQDFKMPEYPPAKPVQQKEPKIVGQTNAPAQAVGQEQVAKKTAQKDLKTVEKAKKIAPKYLKKIKAKREKIIKKLLKDIKADKPIIHILPGFTLLESKEVDADDLVLERALEQIIIRDMIGFINNHPLSQNKLQVELNKRFDRLSDQAPQILIGDVQKVHPNDYEQPKDSRLSIKQQISKYETKRMLIQDPVAESLVEFESQKDWKKIRKQVQDQIIATLITEAAQDLKKRR